MGLVIGGSMATGSRKQDYDWQKDKRKSVFDDEYRLVHDEDESKEIILSQTSDSLVHRLSRGDNN
jgi:hypothetical protein